MRQERIRVRHPAAPTVVRAPALLQSRLDKRSGGGHGVGTLAVAVASGPTGRGNRRCPRDAPGVGGVAIPRARTAGARVSRSECGRVGCLSLLALRTGRLCIVHARLVISDTQIAQ